MKGHRGTNRGRGGKMIVNKDGSTTMIPFQREGQQLGGTVATGGPKVCTQFILVNKLTN